MQGAPFLDIFYHCEAKQLFDAQYLLTPGFILH